MDTVSFLYTFNKRLLDIGVSSAILIIGMPFFIVLATLIKLTSPGPIFYSSLRIGQEGRLFRCWKFRSMFKDAEERLQPLLQKHPEYQAEWSTYFKLKNDPRLTYIGKLLRQTSIDELPQLWNVLWGHLSLVGPRPFLPNELSEVKRVLVEEAPAHLLFSVRPGLTGLWQVSGRNYLTFSDRIRLDLEYIHQRTFLFDLKIIGKTIPMLLWPKGAF